MPTGRILLALVFVFTGLLHFVMPRFYVAIMPPYLPAHRALIYISGFFEMLGGFGLMMPRELAGTHPRVLAAWGLIALLIAVMPANIYMVTDHSRFASIPLWALIVRLPLQLPLIYWAWRYTRPQ